MPQTVRAPRAPLYQMRLGGLGDDAPDFTDLGAPVDTTIDPSIAAYPGPSYQDMLANPNAYQDVFTSTNPNAGVVYGPAGPGQPGSSVSLNPATPSTYAGAPTIAQAIANFFSPKPAPAPPLTRGPSPRVSTVPVGVTSSLTSHLPLIAVGILGIVVISGFAAGRR
jgi:hypothetical protein